MPRMGALVMGVIVLTATFGSGVVVGRQWARRPMVLASESSSKPAAAPRRGALVETESERARGVEDKLTFYRTLTAPLGPAPATTPAAGKPHTEARARASQESPAASREAAQAEPRNPAGAAPASRGATTGRSVAAAAVTEAPGPAVADRAVRVSSAPASAASTGEPAVSWAVQVGVFKGREQAERAHRKLVEGGLQASLTQTVLNGETRYRVRAGSYPSRAEAERVAERVRSDRALPTYITLN